MTTFDNRERGYENKYAHDQETEFNITARRNKLLGIWAAEKMNLDEKKATDYAQSLVEKTTQKDSAFCVLQQIMQDFLTAQIDIDKAEIEKAMEHLLDISRDQLING